MTRTRVAAALMVLGISAGILYMGDAGRVSLAKLLDYEPEIDEPEVCDFSSEPATFPFWNAKEAGYFGDFLNILREVGVKGILESGSLLGAYRHHGVIPYDMDLDVEFNVLLNMDIITGSNGEQLKGKTYDEVVELSKTMDKREFHRLLWDEVLAPLLEPKGIKLVEVLQHHAILRLSNGADRWDGGLCLDPPEGVPMDFGVSLGEDDSIARGDVCVCTYGPTTVYCPSNTKEILTAEYGKDFMIPKSQCEYDKTRERANVKKSRHPDQCHHRSDDECRWAETMIAEKAEKEAQSTSSQSAIPMCPFSESPATFPYWDAAEAGSAFFGNFLSVFTEVGVKGILESGSLLGAYRHHGVIPYDMDLDVEFNVKLNMDIITKSNGELKGKQYDELVALFKTMDEREWHKMLWDEVLAALLEPKGIKLVEVLQHKAILRLSNGADRWDGGLCLDPPAGVPMDFGVTLGDEHSLAKGAVCSCTFGPTSAFCPSDSQKILEDEYGEDFMTPKSQCNYDKERVRAHQKPRHPGMCHHRSDEECRWAEEMIAKKTGQSTSSQTAIPMCPFSESPAKFPYWHDAEAGSEFFGNFLSVFTEVGVKGILESGSLLGAYRHHGVIPYDMDLDVEFNVKLNMDIITKSDGELKGKSYEELVALFKTMDERVWHKMLWDEVLGALLEPKGIQLVEVLQHKAILRLSNGAPKWDGGLCDSPPAGAPMDFGVTLGDDDSLAKGSVCSCTFGPTSAFCPTASQEALSEEYGEDFMIPKSQCEYDKGRVRAHQKPRHPGMCHHRSEDECEWAEKMIAAASGDSTTDGAEK